MKGERYLVHSNERRAFSNTQVYINLINDTIQHAFWYNYSGKSENNWTLCVTTNVNELIWLKVRAEMNHERKVKKSYVKLKNISVLSLISCHWISCMLHIRERGNYFLSGTFVIAKTRLAWTNSQRIRE